MNNWDYRIDWLRAFAIITVVIGHSIILYSADWQIYQTTQSSSLLKYINYAKTVINIYQMPLFFSISGYLFALQKEQPFSHFLRKKLKRLIIPFFVIGLCYMIPVKLLVGYPPYEGKKLTDVVISFLNGSDTGHLWFLPTLFLIFLIVFWLKRLIGSNLYGWLSVLLTGLFLWGLRNRITVSYPRLRYLRFVMEHFWSFSFGTLCGLLFSCIHNMNIKKKRLMAAACFSLLILLAFLPVHVPSVFYSNLICSGLYFLATNCQNRTISKISTHSFGIYLFHSPLIYITLTWLLNAHPIVVGSVNCLFFGGIAYLLADICGRTKARFLIGL